MNCGIGVEIWEYLPRSSSHQGYRMQDPEYREKYINSIDTCGNGKLDTPQYQLCHAPAIVTLC